MSKTNDEIEEALGRIEVLEALTERLRARAGLRLRLLSDECANCGCNWGEHSVAEGVHPVAEADHMCPSWKVGRPWSHFEPVPGCTDDEGDGR